jgi:SAM-dependent methyltransferase
MFDSKQNLNRTISPADHMLTVGEDVYFRTALSAIKIIDSIVSTARDADTVTRILDFGCGYGRVLRTFPLAFPKANVTACDLMPEAVNFCAKTFRALPLMGNEDLSAIAPTAPFDVIWAGSVLTHLPPQNWGRMIGFFRDRLRPEGVMLFSTHGRRAMWVFQEHTFKGKQGPVDAAAFENAKIGFKETGYAFIPYGAKHTQKLNAIGISITENLYGLSFASPAWVTLFIEQFPDLTLVGYAEGGWGNNHDVVALKKPKLPWNEPVATVQQKFSKS